jgi:hypothetical protein
VFAGHAISPFAGIEGTNLRDACQNVELLYNAGKGSSACWRDFFWQSARTDNNTAGSASTSEIVVVNKIMTSVATAQNHIWKGRTRGGSPTWGPSPPHPFSP